MMARYVLLSLLVVAAIASMAAAQSDIDGDGWCSNNPGGTGGTLGGGDDCPINNDPTDIDCDDGDPTIFPGGDDNNCNGDDNNCDGQVDNGYTPHEIYCGDGYCAVTVMSSCNPGGMEDTSCEPGPKLSETDETCDNVDDDCDGVADDDYSRVISCGIGACEMPGIETCAEGNPMPDCTPGEMLSETDETCDNVDDDCDNNIDEDYFQVTECGTGYCFNTGTETCSGGNPMDDCVPGDQLSTTDDTCDNVDDDCDDNTDEDYSEVITCGYGVCQATGTQTCVNGETMDDCVVGEEIGPDDNCDNVDDDCDNIVDEDYSEPTECGIGACYRTGTETCSFGSLDDDCMPGTPAADDATCDGVDDDCDGNTDEDWVSEPTTCGVGACVSTGFSTCVAFVEDDGCEEGSPGDESSFPCNGIDEDCDGNIDEFYDADMDGYTYGSMFYFVCGACFCVQCLCVFF